MNMSKLRQFKGDFQGGFSSSILSIFQCVPYGLIAFAPLGAEFENAGIMACIIGSVLAGFFAALFGGSPAQITGPGAAVCLAFSYIIIYLKELHPFDPKLIDNIPFILSLTFFTIFLTGFFQLLFGLLKADYLIKFISYPVNAGIATGAGILIVSGALWKLLGISNAHHSFALVEHLGEIKFGSFFVGIATAIFLWYRTSVIKGFLGFPLAMAAGTGVYYFLLFIGIGRESLGETFEKFAFTTPFRQSLTSTLAVVGDKNFVTYLKILSPLAFNLAIFCSLQSLLSVLALKNISERAANSRQELIGQGIGNMMSGCFGGTPSCGTFSRSFLNFQEGGRTKLSGMICALMTFLFALLFSGYIQYLPKAVASGVVLVLGLNAIDKWTIDLFHKILTGKVVISKELLVNTGIILSVMALIFSGNFMTAIGVGVLISIVGFLGKMRGILIRRIYENQSIPTKNIDSEGMMKFFSQHHQEIKVIELGGLIYFGSAEKLSEEIVRLANNGANYMILDLKKVDGIDLTGARVLEKSYETLKKQGKCLGFSHFVKGSPVWQFLDSIQFFDKIDSSLIFLDTDRALEYFEDLLFLSYKQKRTDIEMNLSDFPVFQELTKDEIENLRGFLQPETYKKGQIIFHQGDAGDAMFFIAKGSVDIMIAVDDKQLARDKRVQSLSSGTFFGEIALLQKGPRTATVIASSDLVCYRLSKEQFQNLISESSHLSVSFLANISKILSKRLMFINHLISEMER